MAMLLDAVVGALVGELLSTVLEMKDKAVKFTPTLQKLQSTLEAIGPTVKEREDLYRKLNRPEKETSTLIDQMKSGKDLVLKCSEVQWWNCCYKADYQEELEELNASIFSFFNLNLQIQIARDGAEVLVEVREIRTEIRNIVPRNEIRGVCSPPKPPEFTVGLDVPMNELKLKLLQDQISVSVLTVTGSGGLGKTTLAKTLCWDDQVKDKFKENIFFVTFGKTPKLNTIVQRLFQHKGYQEPEFQNDEDMVNQLEHLLGQIVKSPILIVLDDVWTGSESLVEKFVFQIPNYKILVTSRFAIRRFGPLYVLKPLGDADAINLFHHSASLNQSSSDIPHDDVIKIVRGCGGFPLALRMSGSSLSQENPVFWHNRARKLSEGHSILDSSSDVLDCLQNIFDVLDPKVIECFRDLGLFPEGQRIPAAALVDMWAELHREDEANAMEKIYEQVNLNMADIFVTRKVASGTIDYKYHYVTQHGLLRELAICQTSQELVEKRNRLIIDISGNNVPEWWNGGNEYHIAARILSISTDEAFTSEWCNLQPTEVEVLVLNLRQKKCKLPMFMKKMNKLKVLVITNYDFHLADLENFELLGYLSGLKRIRLEKVSIPFLCQTGMPLKNLQKFSIFMCNVNEAFRNCDIQVSDMLPNLVEMNIDYCIMVELPVGFSNIVFLKKLSITNCHKLSALPEGIGNLVNLETLRLSSCTDLEELPDSITSLQNLKFLDISDCIMLSKLPEKMGELRNLERINVCGCSSLRELPFSIKDLGSLRDVVCDEERAALWEPFKTILSDLKLEEVQVDMDLSWLL
ncbi:probable disease resistance protein At5g66900 [Gastrolobium bilobum]|uniref:probable disease resistance protein At5g66900 n=1 Tax=Gastrolobium bilobum TaxID=150636 RepID=UPI002AB0A08B|nr:probable disease resistance protein At5g66900 [Gastrolobium bilobum]